MRTVAFHTLGCKVNQYDSQAMLELFEQAGYTSVPFHGDADVYVINTCTVTGTGDKKSLQLARRVRREHPDSELVLCGCLAQRQGEELLSTGARLVLGTQRRGEVVQLLQQAVAEGRQLCAVGPLRAASPFEPLRVSAQAERTRAVLKIQEGCDNRCTYCIIPSVRGPIRSRPPEEVLAEAGRLAAAGYQELVLTGIHLTSYGRDLPGHPGLLDALAPLQSLPGITRIRLGSLEPVVATEDFVRGLGGMDKICPQFHLALQSGSDSVLRRMKRRYNSDQYRRAVERLRAVWPLAAITSDLLTGFPGETEEEHRETLRMVAEIGFARVHVFPYSPRAGTPAADMPGQVPQRVKEERVRQLIEAGAASALAYHRLWEGRTAQVLAEDCEGGVLFGYTPEYIRVSLPHCDPALSGKTLRVRLTAPSPEGMCGEPDKEEEAIQAAMH